MAVNFYDTANQLAEELKQSNEFLALQKAFADIKNDDFAYASFKKFQEKQQQLQQTQMNGQEITDDDIKEMQTMTEQLTKFDSINALMEKERAMSTIMDDLNRIIAKPIADIYQP